MISEAVPSAVLPTPLAVLYRHVWTHAEGARGRLAAALAMLGSSQLLKLAMPWMAAQAINSIQVAGRAGLQTAAGWIGAILVLHLGVWCLHGPARVMERSVALRVRRSIADALYTRLAHAPLAWHDGHHSGDLQHRVGQASGALYGFTESQFIYLQNLINVVGPLLALYWLSPLTAAMALTGFLLSGVVIVRFDSSLMKLAERENAAERRYAARLIDFVGNISAVASLRLQEATRRLLDSKLAAVFLPLQRSIVLTEWKWCAVDLLTVGVSWALVMIYAASMAASQAPTVAGAGGLLIGSLFMVYQYAQQAAGVLCSMASNYQNLARTQTDFASADIIHEAPMPAAVLEGHHSGWQRLELKDLSYRHARSERGGIEGVTLTLQRGERLALVGESGSGKSTLLRVLAGLYHADRGAVAIDGFVQPGRRHAGDLATLLPQEAEVFEASMRENITLDQVVSESDVQKAVHASALDTVVAGLPQGLDTAMSERGFNLSGGQRQRLALARGVLAARHSSLLLLDEPTSALDAITEHLVHQRLASAFPRACIVAAVHRLELLPRFDRVAFMAAGRVVDIGTADELSARQPRFAALCKGTEAARRATARAAAI